jgi:hypothetical protein
MPDRFMAATVAKRIIEYEVRGMLFMELRDIVAEVAQGGLDLLVAKREAALKAAIEREKAEKEKGPEDTPPTP